MLADKEKSFKDTLNLPKSDFPITYNKNTDAEIINIWQTKNIYHSTFSYKANFSKNKPLFVLHWGPPYANGSLHLGHVLTGSLKDFVVKSKFKAGYAVDFRYGVDCHGMPIEIKVAEQLGLSKDQIAKSPASFKTECRKYAQGWSEIQTSEHRNLGIIGDYENHYATMSFDYEASIVRSFGDMFQKGFIKRKKKSVPWCPSCATVLAISEIEYNDRKDPSIFVKFDLTEKSKADILSNLKMSDLADHRISFLVWTTTPWTIPLNKGLIFNPNSDYAIVQCEDDNELLIMGASSVEKIENKSNKKLKKLISFPASILKDVYAKHIMNIPELIPVVFDQMVGLDDGTAIVHCAPGCGPEDYLVGIKNNLEIYSPITENGCYSSQANVEEIKGMSVSQGQGWVIKFLADNNKLFLKESINHSYPHCWRCRNGLIFRATKQWFCDLIHNNLQDKVLESIENIEFIPSWGKARFRSFIGNRNEWCISRQRYWGVPIVALKCLDCDEAFTNNNLMDYVAKNFESYGLEFWDNISIEELKKSSVVPNDLKCNECSSQNFIKETDILDVWFDSGTSHIPVLQNRDPILFPADLYLEGSDQHRGWFQSSVLTSMIIHEKVPMKAILTHGYVVDQNKHKMSKSKGNDLKLADVTKTYCTDIIRLWVASSDYTKDISVSMDIFKATAEMYRKIRNTCRFMLLNLYDVDTTVILQNDYLKNYDWLSLSVLDRYALGKLLTVIKKIDEAYNNFDFTTVVHEINIFCITDLSAGYLDMVKDKLYVSQSDGPERKNTQITLMVILDYLIHRISPIMSFLAEDVYRYFNKTGLSIFEVSQPSSNDLEEIINSWDSFFKTKDLTSSFEVCEKMRSAVFKKIEREREKGIVKLSLESMVNINLDYTHSNAQQILAILDLSKFKEGTTSFLKSWLGVSQVNLNQKQPELETSELEGIFISASKAIGIKCPRCWQWEEPSNEDNLCSRCYEIVSKKSSF